MKSVGSVRIGVLLLPFAVLAMAENKPAELTVGLCDGETSVVVAGVREGEKLERGRAQAVADELMQAWTAKQDPTLRAAWVAEDQDGRVRVAAAQAPPPPALAAPAAAVGQPTKFTARDQMLWKREEQKWIADGYKAYHSADALGGTIGVSCDMCHPDGANTHPETYPKYQIQRKQVALLRDMINWCIENPMKGKPLAENDPLLRAVEAYILSTRKGVALEPGKH